MALEWTQKLSVGVNEIDGQHKELFVRVNKLLDATSQGKGKDEVGKVVDFLADYVVKHFGTEEKFMTSHKYPGFVAHKAQHTQFLSEFAGLKAKFNQEGASSQLVIAIQQKVCRWLIDHIGKVDKEMGTFWQANG